MRTLYLDCNMGAAGDMLAASLLELLPEQEAFLEQMNDLGIPHVQVKTERVSKCGILGTYFCVKAGETQEGEEMHEHTHEQESAVHAHEDSGHIHEHAHKTAHHHSSMKEIEHILSHLKLEETVRRDVLAVYNLIAEAESHVHGVPVTDIHFHEVGTLDAIADITAVCLLIHRLKPDKIFASPIQTGSGEVRCAHGILPVPAPATAYLLRGIPVYSGEIKGELCTPTGAALLKHFVSQFAEMPEIKIESIGYGMGKKDFGRANCVRALLGETKDQKDMALELSCNVDDMTAEEIGFAMERLFEGGALEVYTIPIGMKKSRPGTLIRAICTQENREAVRELLFRHTTTLGIREIETQRYVLEREVVTVDTIYGPVRRKDSFGYGIRRSKYEYEDLARIARERGISIEEVKGRIENISAWHF